VAGQHAGYFFYPAGFVKNMNGCCGAPGFGMFCYRPVFSANALFAADGDTQYLVTAGKFRQLGADYLAGRATDTGINFIKDKDRYPSAFVSIVLIANITRDISPPDAMVRSGPVCSRCWRKKEIQCRPVHRLPVPGYGRIVRKSGLFSCRGLPVPE